MCSGDDHGDVDRRIIPASSIRRNSAWAMSSLAASRRRGLAKTGGPVVTMWCSTPCFGFKSLKEAPITSGKSSSRFWTAAGTSTTETAGSSLEVLTVKIGVNVDESRICRPGTSTNQRFAAKKSIPRMGRSTAASKNECENSRPPNRREKRRLPQEGKLEPSAWRRRRVLAAAADWCGNKLTVAPVSTKKSIPLRSSCKYSKPGKPSAAASAAKTAGAAGNSGGVGGGDG